MIDKSGRPLIAIAGEREICITPSLVNRHGLVTGATGTGKTVTLQTLAETFSALGIPVFMSDAKGDLSGISMQGNPDSKAAKRALELGLMEKGYANQAFPVCFWDVFGARGHPVRATASDVGPLLLSRLLCLNDVQSAVLQLVFRIADDNGLLLLDLKDLRSMSQYVADSRDQFKTTYGQIAPSTIGAIQRALLRVGDEGGGEFFGEPAFDVMDLLKTGSDGKGVVNILDASRLSGSPGLYSCVLIWMLSELYERLPEAGDQPLPRLAFFIDEAHLVFDGISSALLQKMEQVARLIRSRGVGLYFVSQNPSDIPDSILGQLGNRVQHALRAFTPKDRKAVRAAAQAFRPNPAFSTEDAISNLAVGEALVSLLDENGAPQVVERALIVPPQSAIGPVSDGQRAEMMRKSPFAGIYDNAIDRESAYEILAARAAWLEGAQEAAESREREEREAMAGEARARKEEAERRKAGDPLGNILGSVLRNTARGASSAMAKEIGRTIFGPGAGGKIGTSIVRGILGGLLGGRR